MRMRHVYAYTYAFHDIVELLNEITGIYPLSPHSSGPSGGLLFGSHT
jgi:hypothetical protein